MIDVRHGLTVPFLQEYGGHIGCAVRPSERKKGYATRMLKLSLSYCSSIGIPVVRLGCYTDNQAYFFCSSYRKTPDVCSAHYIREIIVVKAVLESMQRVFWYVQSFEKDFARKQMAAFGEEKKKELSEKRRELAQAEKRVKEIDSLIQKIYGDNVSGKISDERFATRSIAFEDEQKQLKASIPIMELVPWN